MAGLRRLLRAVLLIAGVIVVVAGCQIVRNSGQSDLPPEPERGLRLATYNVHYIDLDADGGSWSRADWERRKAPLDAAFKALGADIIAFQEMETFTRSGAGTPNLTLDWLLAQNPGYGAAATGDPAVFPSTQPIFYRRDRLAMTQQGWFFFSDTPEVIYSRTFNGGYPAFASWAEFDTGGNRFKVVNIHTDFASSSNRLSSVALVAERITPWLAAGETVLVMGDMNARLGSKTLAVMEEVGVTFLPVQGATYHFNRGLNLFGAIDHIGLSGAATPLGPPVVLRQRFGGEWPTDHYPVVADIRLAP